MQEKQVFHALGVDPDTSSRMRLKQATLAVPLFRDVGLFSHINEAFNKLEAAGSEYDVLFVSERLPENEVAHFVSQAKTFERSRDAAIVLLIAGSSATDSNAAQKLLEGFDGCLVEPYSVDALTEITRLAAVVKRRNWQDRQRVVINFLIQDIIKRIDRLAYIKQCQARIGEVLAQFRKTCAAFSEFDEFCLSEYFNAAADAFAKTAPYQGVPGYAEYKGVSTRIKKRMLEKLINESSQETCRGGA